MIQHTTSQGAKPGNSSCMESHVQCKKSAMIAPRPSAALASLNGQSAHLEACCTALLPICPFSALQRLVLTPSPPPRLLGCRFDDLDLQHAVPSGTGCAPGQWVPHGGSCSIAKDGYDCVAATCSLRQWTWAICTPKSCPFSSLLASLAAGVTATGTNCKTGLSTTHNSNCTLSKTGYDCTAAACSFGIWRGAVPTSIDCEHSTAQGVAYGAGQGIYSKHVVTGEEMRQNWPQSGCANKYAQVVALPPVSCSPRRERQTHTQWGDERGRRPSRCPPGHPYAYRPGSNFDYCCATGEDTWGNVHANSEYRMGRASTCKDQNYVACPGPAPCQDAGGECPASHPYAFRPGSNFDLCCATAEDKSGNKIRNAGLRNSRADVCAGDKFVPCPGGAPCSDAPPATFFRTPSSLFATARAQCQTGGGGLVVITDAEKDRAVNAFVQVNV
jgi:hypothetical protein